MIIASRLLFSVVCSQRGVFVLLSLWVFIGQPVKAQDLARLRQIHARVFEEYDLRDTTYLRQLQLPHHSMEVRSRSALILSEALRQQEEFRQALPLAELGLQLGRKLNQDSLIFLGNLMIAEIQAVSSEPAKALAPGYEAQRIAHQHQWHHLAALSCMTLFKAVRPLGEEQEALHLLHQALDYNSRQPHLNTKARIHNSLGGLLSDTGEREKGKVHFGAALDILRKSNNAHFLTIVLINLGTLHRELGNLPEAEKLAREALRVSEREELMDGIAGSWSLLGQTAIGNPQEAKAYIRKSIQAYEQLGESFHLIPELLSLAKLLLQEGQEIEALKLLHRAMALGQSMQVRGPLADVYEELARYYELQQQDDSAVYYLRRQQALLKTESNRNLQNQLQQFESRLELVRQQNLNELLKSEALFQFRLRRNLIIGLVLACVAFVVIWLQWRRSRKKTHELIRKNLTIEDQRRELREYLQEIERTRDQMVRQEKQASLGLLAAGVAHELNNPLNFISGSAQVLEWGLAQIPPEVRIPGWSEHLQHISEGVRRCTLIIKSLMHFAGPQSDDFIRVNLVSCVDYALTILNRKIADRNIKVCIECETNQVWVNGNETRLIQLMVNLMDNALHVTPPENPTIRVVVTQADPLAIFSVIDFGPGIVPENQKKIYDPFFTTKPVGEGTGLGLYITHQIVQDHQAQISFSTGPGGTTFNVTFPSTQ